MDYNPESFIDDIQRILHDVNNEMSEKSWKILNENIRSVESLEEAIDIINDKKGIISFNWCGENSCGTDLEEKMRVDILGIQKDCLGENKCINCDNPAKHVTLLARTY